MYYKKELSERGTYKDTENNVYVLSECNAAHTPQGLNVGYTFYSTRQECLTACGLEAVVKDAT